jgi:hypothetical protein
LTNEACASTNFSAIRGDVGRKETNDQGKSLKLGELATFEVTFKKPRKASAK